VLLVNILYLYVLLSSPSPLTYFNTQGHAVISPEYAFYVTLNFILCNIEKFPILNVITVFLSAPVFSLHDITGTIILELSGKLSAVKFLFGNVTSNGFLNSTLHQLLPSLVNVVLKFFEL
jgi:hypothetical protein